MTKINFNKSFFVCPGDENLSISLILDTFGCKEEQFPIKYLGISLNPGRLNRWDRDPLFDTFEKKLEGWRGNLLFLGEKVVILNAILSYLPPYYMSLFVLPRQVKEKIDRIWKRFLWNRSTTSSNKYHMVSWGQVCKPRQAGELGILDLKTFNMVLMTKWWWHLLKRPNRSFHKLVQLKYRLRTST